MSDDLWAKAQLQKKTADNVCTACRKPILPGHRVQACYICLDPNARNPERITERGLELGTDHEFVHCRCEDPYLDGRRVLLT
jgi:hypothetical protein